MCDGLTVDLKTLFQSTLSVRRATVDYSWEVLL